MSDAEYVCTVCHATTTSWRKGRCPNCGGKLIHQDNYVEGEKE